MNTDIDWSKHITDCLNSTEYCCLATLSKNSTWANPVYFSYDNDINLYFISQPHSLHMKNIEKSPKLSIAIYDTSQSTHGDVCGIQMEAEAKIVNDVSSASAAYDIYFGRVYPKTRKNEEKPNPEDYCGEDADWIFVRTSPINIWYFDTRHFGDERAEVPSNTKINGI